MADAPSLGFSAIGHVELVGPRMAASSLRPFSNHSRCACGNGRRIRVHYDPGCQQVEGPHFHRLCPCGGEYLEAGYSDSAGAVGLPA